MLITPPLALYVHFPWCVQKCPYCDFNSHALRGELPADQYIDAAPAAHHFLDSQLNRFFGGYVQGQRGKTLLVWWSPFRLGRRTHGGGHAPAAFIKMQAGGFTNAGRSTGYQNNFVHDAPLQAGHGLP